MTSGSEQVARLVAESRPLSDDALGRAAASERPATPSEHDPDGDIAAGWDEVADGPSLGDIGRVDPEVVRACAGLDHSDTDNAERLIRHLGHDLSVVAQEGVTGGDFAHWKVNHWDIAGGAAGAQIVAQGLGGRIALEAMLLQPSDDEAEVIRRAKPLRDLDEPSEAQKRLVAEADKFEDKVRKRRERRRAFAVTSKNKGRIEAALALAAPRLRRAPDAFNPHRLRFACLSHTLTVARVQDLECPDPDVVRWTGEVTAVPGHDRADWITAVVPVCWDPDAEAKTWTEFLARMLPDAAKRRTVQQFAGLGLLGVPVQHVMFHYGLGANGKSVFLETLVRILGPGLAVGLPRESIVGGSDRSSGGASPDLARLYGKRMVRILELKGNVPLQEDLIKRLTGGEAFPVRTLFKGYFEFQSIATAHMSGNGKPTIDGTDNGIWRRMLLVHWDQTIPEAERRDFEEVVSGFVRDEGPGILAWLVAGVLDWLAHGLAIAPAIVADTQEYRDEMDPIGLFLASCVKAEPNVNVQASAMYEAYVSWSMANAKRAASQQKFGRVLGERFHKIESGGRNFYTDCALHDVPARPTHDEDTPRSPYAERRG